VAALGVVAVVAVGGAAVARMGSADGGGSEPGGSGAEVDGWRSSGHGNAEMLSADDDVVCSADSTEVWCLEAGSGDERFSVPLDGGMATSPVLLDDRMLVASTGMVRGDLHAFSLDGQELWSTSIEIDTRLDMPVADGVLAAIDDEALVGVRVADGGEEWREYGLDEGGPGVDDLEGPRAVGDNVFTDGTYFYAPIEFFETWSGTAYGHIVAVDPASGGEVWRSEPLDDIGFGVSVTDAAPFEDGSAVAFLMEGTARRIVVLDAITGEMRWDAPVASEYADIVDAGGATIVADGPDMRALDRDGDTVWQVPSPVIARSPSLLGPGELVHERDRLFIAGVDVLEVDPATGESELLRPDVNATDVAVTADLLVIAGIEQVEAIPLPPSGGPGDGE
jgi:outer membrane protein assembly factor BamB